MKATFPDYSVRHSLSAKNLRLKVTREDGLIVVVPHGYDAKKVPALLNQKRLWITDALRRIGETKRFLEPTPSKHLPDTVRLVAIGETWTITYHEEERYAGIRLRAVGEQLVLSGADLNRHDVMRKLNNWLRVRVRERLFPVANTLAKKHGLKLGALFVKSQRTRWASCSARRNLSLNTKLLFLSPDIVRYVIVHELCHTVHMNHTKEFWRLVAAYEPSYKILDEKLRMAWKQVPQWVF